MEQVVDNLEALFQRAETDLDNLQKRVDGEFQIGDSQSKVPETTLKPGEIISKLSDIKTEFAALVQETQSIKEAYGEAVTCIKSELLRVCDVLKSLEQKAGMQEPKTEEEITVETLLGVKREVPSSDLPTSAEAADSIGASPQVVINFSPDPEHLLFCSPPAERSPSSYSAVTRAEFESVSALVRGRVKLEDVNRTYALLWRHFKEEGNTKPLSSVEMHKMGLRVTGQTGLAKLHVLRSLKLLKISKAGDVNVV